MTAKIIPLKPTRSYVGQYLKTVVRRNKSGIRHEYWFKPDPKQRPLEWDKRHPPSIRLPRDKSLRNGMDKKFSPREYAAAWTEAAVLFTEINRLRRGPDDGGKWAHGTLRWLTASWLKSPWFRDDLAANTQRLYNQQIKVIDDWADRTAKGNSGIHPRITQLSPKGVAAFLHQFDDRPTKRRHIRRVLKNICAFAIEMGLRNDNPVDGIVMRRTKGKKRTTVLWTQGFVNKAVEWGDENGHPEVSAMILLMWDCGRRPNDIFRLVAMNDMDRQRLLNGSLNSSTRPILYDPQEKAILGWVAKTGNYIEIPLDAATIAAIDKVCPSPTENRRNLFVHQKTGEPYTTDTWKWLWYSVRDHAEEPTAKWQNGRASSIVRNKRAGLDDAAIITLSDHSNPETVYRSYWTPDSSQAAEAKRKRAEFENNE